ncbi:MAG: M20/M25/M40 family metallo-hydrolase [Oligoflexia bacterium]|nr:M20/M25/M40 family metallo-hydrolase [Oligoflexia bacterium]
MGELEVFKFGNGCTAGERRRDSQEPLAAHGLKEDLETIATVATGNLQELVAIDSESFEDSPTIPSSAGQNIILKALREKHELLGYRCEQDQNANLIVRIPATSAELAARPAVALMVHVDTSEGTRAIPELCIQKQWDGTNVPYPNNPALNVSAARYPELARFVGEDLIYGPGDYPFGLDDKLGCSILGTLAQLLRSNPEHRHGPVVLVFRPDEEIGRMAAVEGLAQQLATEQIPCGFTLDGIEPFEVNIESFNAAQAKINRRSKFFELTPAVMAVTAEVSMVGVTTHGATAKAEGHLNATTIFSRLMQLLDNHPQIVPIGFVSDQKVESNGSARFVLSGNTTQEIALHGALLEMALERVVGPHAWKGASYRIETKEYDGALLDDGAINLAKFLHQFYLQDTGFPLYPEESAGREGYSNPYFASTENQQLTIRIRLRDFETAELENRIQHARYMTVRSFGEDGAQFEAEYQYENMGPSMAGAQPLIELAQAAARKVGVEAPLLPIRGGTGVDPFVTRGVLVPNLGTGYFAPESEKELTTRQSMARHVQWIAALLQEMAQD